MRISHILPKVLADSPQWSALLAAMDEVVSVPVGKRVRRMADRSGVDSMVVRHDDVRAADLDADAVQMVRDLARTLGFAYRDGGRFTDTEVLRYLQDIAHFSNHRASDRYLDYFAYLSGLQFTSKPLWYDTRRQELVEETPAIVAGASSLSSTTFPTPYLEIGIDSTLYEGSRYTYAELEDLFYSVAPMNLVLRRLVVQPDVDPIVIRVGMAAVPVHVVTTGDLIAAIPPVEARTGISLDLTPGAFVYQEVVESVYEIRDGQRVPITISMQTVVVTSDPIAGRLLETVEAVDIEAPLDMDVQ